MIRDTILSSHIGPNPQSLIEGLPTELLERILLFTSTRDILRLSSVSAITKTTLIHGFADWRAPKRSTALSMVLYKNLH